MQLFSSGLAEVAVVLLQQPSGRFFVHRRSGDKKIFPNKYGVGIGGKVLSGESARQAALREMQEEAGVSGNLEFCFHLLYQSELVSHKMSVFHCLFEGEVYPTSREFNWWAWLTSSDIQRLGAQHKLCPDTRVFYRRFLDFTHRT